jgi:PAS domain S-box-containing protein
VRKHSPARAPAHGRSRRHPAAKRTRQGRFTPRLSDSARGGRHRSFRLDSSFFFQVVDSLSEYAVITTDRELRVSSWNAAAEHVFGYTEEEVIGRSIGLLFTDEDRRSGFPEKEFDEALEKQRVEDVRYHLRKDGGRVWCYGLSFPLKDAERAVRGFVKLIRDESEKKKLDDALVEREERLRLAVEATGMGTWDFHPETGRLSLSPECRRILALPKDAKPGYEGFLRCAAEEDRPRLDASIRECLGGGSRSCDVELRVETGDGTLRWATLRAKMTPRSPADDGVPARMIGLVVDSTQKKLAALKGAEAADELERRVKERTASLRVSNDELESFAYSASHDLRAPLRKMQAYSQAILDDEGGRLTERGRGYFEKIRAAAASMSTLIDATLDLSVATRRKMTVQEVDLSAMAEDVASELRRSEPERQAEFVIAPGLRARADAGLLELALRNLLDNAWKFTRRREGARIEFGSSPAGTGEAFFVRDNGVGFDSRDAARIFHPFETLHERTEYPGRGVGLGIVQRVVRRHGGRLWAEGDPGRGATFWFTLHSEEP